MTRARVRDALRVIHTQEPERAGQVNRGTDARRDYELSILWRTVVWSGPIAGNPNQMREESDPYERLLRIFLEALGAGLETRMPSPGDIGILLGSSDPRVRLAGVRLAGRGQ